MTTVRRGGEITVRDRLISIREVEQIAGLKQSAIYDRMQRGQFPIARALGPRTVRWVESEVLAWKDELPNVQVREAIQRQA